MNNKVLTKEYIKAVQDRNAVKMQRIAWTGLVSDQFRIVKAIEYKRCELLKDDESIVLKVAKEYLSNNRTEIALNDILRCNILPDITLHNLALSFAYHVLPIYEAKYPNDLRPRNALVAKEKWLKGEISDKELEKARTAGYAAGDAAWNAAGNAVWRAGGRAEEYAAWGAAYWARKAVKDRNKELQWQIDEVLKVLK